MLAAVGYPSSETGVLEQRETLGLPLDGLRVVTREVINETVSRSGLHHLHKRQGVSRLLTVPKEDAAHKPVRADESGGVSVAVKVVPPMIAEDKRHALCVASDRATRWAFLPIKPTSMASSAQAVLSALPKAGPLRNRKALAHHDNVHHQSVRLTAEGSSRALSALDSARLLGSSPT